MAKGDSKLGLDWSLKDLDHNIEVKMQFPLSEGVRISVGGNVAEQPRFGLQDPVVQWVAGRTRTFTFNTMLFARHESEDIASKLRALEKLATRDPFLGRTPICYFTYGDTVSETVLVETVDEELIDVLQFSGQPRRVNLSISMKRYIPFSQTALDPSKPKKESYYLVASAAERSYEAIAKRFYGDPMLGDRLRKRHPEYPFTPEIGMKVHVPPKAVLLTEVVEPASHVFQLDDKDAVQAYENILADRNTRKAIMII